MSLAGTAALWTRCPGTLPIPAFPRRIHLSLSTAVLVALSLLVLVASATYGTLQQQALAILVCLYTAARLMARRAESPHIRRKPSAP